MFGGEFYSRGFSLQDEPAFSFCGQGLYDHTMLTADLYRKRSLSCLIFVLWMHFCWCFSLGKEMKYWHSKLLWFGSYYDYLVNTDFFLEIISYS